MDPSVALVSSLPSHLLTAVDNARRFFKNVSDAPKELDRIVDSLDQRYHLLNDATQIISRLEIANGPPDPPQSLVSALKICEARLADLEKFMAKYQSAFTKQDAFSRTFSSWRLSLRKKDIDEYEKLISRAITILQTSVSLYSLSMQ
jgi:hypothetical protein